MAIFKKIIVAILSWESRIILAKYKPYIIAVTGSVGKTSTKDAIFDVLKGREKYVRKSDKSMNSEIGLPLTVIGVPNAWHSLSGWVSNIMKGLGLIFGKNEYPNCLVLEIGADHPGDIERVTRWLKPDISVLTKVSDVPVHVEFFHSPEEVFEEKAYLARAVKASGTLVLFADSDKVMSLAEEARNRAVQVISYGLGSTANVKGNYTGVRYEGDRPAGISFILEMGEDKKEIRVDGIIGSTYMYPLLAAAAVAKARGMDIHETAKALEKYEGPKGRMKILKGIKGATIIDDTYNSSPDAVVSALSVLKETVVRGRKVAILGDMMELGKHSVDEHKKIGKVVAESVDVFVAVGPRTRNTAETAIESGMKEDSVKLYPSSKDAAREIADMIGEGDIILVKGSQSARMERIVAELIAPDVDRASSLVRQEQEWLDKA